MLSHTSPVEIHDIAALADIVGQHVPGQRVVAVPHAQKAAERHDGVGDLSRDLVDCRRMDGAELFAPFVLDTADLKDAKALLDELR